MPYPSMRAVDNLISLQKKPMGSCLARFLVSLLQLQASVRTLHGKLSVFKQQSRGRSKIHSDINTSIPFHRAAQNCFPTASYFYYNTTTALHYCRCCSLAFSLSFTINSIVSSVTLCLPSPITIWPTMRTLTSKFRLIPKRRFSKASDSAPRCVPSFSFCF